MKLVACDADQPATYVINRLRTTTKAADRRKERLAHNIAARLIVPAKLTVNVPPHRRQVPVIKKRKGLAVARLNPPDKLPVRVHSLSSNSTPIL